MIIKKEIKDKLPITDLENLYVVADFDHTITKGSSKTTWSVLASSDLVSNRYIEDRQDLFDKYHPIEIDDSLDINYRNQMMIEWWKKHVELFINYKISQKAFDIESKDLSNMELKKGTKEFLEFLHNSNIPLIIISAGIGNFIEAFLEKNNCYYDNIYISSNIIAFKDGLVSGINNKIIHSLNKNEVSLPSEITKRLEGRNKVLLLGDQISDLNMVNKNNHDFVLTVGFTNEETKENISAYEASFDIVCEENDDYFDLKKIIF